MALICDALHLALAFGLRTLIQLRRRGSAGFHEIGGRVGSSEWYTGALFVVALALGVAAPVLALMDLVEPLEAIDRPAAHLAGIGLFAAGLVATLAAQFAMGTSSRIGVEPGGRATLVTDGPFRAMRNPSFAAMLPTSLGLALMVTSWLAWVAVAALVVALELQVRLVEERYLLATHGKEYANYARRVGRFVPGVGRLGAR